MSENLGDNNSSYNNDHSHGHDSSASSPSAPQNADEKKEHLNIKVCGEGYPQMVFKIRKNTPFKKLMDAYSEKQNKSLSTMRFIFDGERIAPEDTAETLQIEDGEMIEVRTVQVGGHY